MNNIYCTHICRNIREIAGFQWLTNHPTIILHKSQLLLFSLKKMFLLFIKDRRSISLPTLKTRCIYEQLNDLIVFIQQGGDLSSPQQLLYQFYLVKQKIIILMSNYYPKTLRQWKIRRRTSTDQQSQISKKPGSLMNRSLIIHSLDQKQKYSHQNKEKYSKLLSSIANTQNWRQIKSKQQFRKTYTSPQIFMRKSRDRCVMKFEKLIKEEQQLKTASNLDVLVKNFLKSSAGKRKNVKNFRKAVLKGEDDKNKLSKLLQISTSRNQIKEIANIIEKQRFMTKKQWSQKFTQDHGACQTNQYIKAKLQKTEKINEQDQLLNITEMNLKNRENKKYCRKNTNGNFLNKSQQITSNRIKKNADQSMKYQINKITQITPWNFSQD